jgi:hypothetical protein
MALKLHAESPQGFDAPNAYHRVEILTLNGKSSMSFFLRSYESSSASVAFDERVYSCDYDIAGGNPIKQAYEHLKTLPEFADAADV